VGKITASSYEFVWGLKIWTKNGYMKVWHKLSNNKQSQNVFVNCLQDIGWNFIA
jgi:hypothetical protein